MKRRKNISSIINAPIIKQGKKSDHQLLRPSVSRLGERAISQTPTKSSIVHTPFSAPVLLKNASQLPPEILSLIFSYLPYTVNKMMNTVATICKLFRRIVYGGSFIGTCIILPENKAISAESRLKNEAMVKWIQKYVENISDKRGNKNQTHNATFVMAHRYVVLRNWEKSFQLVPLGVFASVKNLHLHHVALSRASLHQLLQQAADTLVELTISCLFISEFGNAATDDIRNLGGFDLKGIKRSRFLKRLNIEIDVRERVGDLSTQFLLQYLSAFLTEAETVHLSFKQLTRDADLYMGHLFILFEAVRMTHIVVTFKEEEAIMNIFPTLQSQWTDIKSLTVHGYYCDFTVTSTEADEQGISKLLNFKGASILENELLMFLMFYGNTVNALSLTILDKEITKMPSSQGQNALLIKESRKYVTPYELSRVLSQCPHLMTFCIVNCLMVPLFACLKEIHTACTNIRELQFCFDDGIIAMNQAFAIFSKKLEYLVVHPSPTYYKQSQLNSFKDKEVRWYNTQAYAELEKLEYLQLPKISHWAFEDMLALLICAPKLKILKVPNFQVNKRDAMALYALYQQNQGPRLNSLRNSLRRSVSSFTAASASATNIYSLSASLPPLTSLSEIKCNVIPPRDICLSSISFPQGPEQIPEFFSNLLAVFVDNIVRGLQGITFETKKGKLRDNFMFRYLLSLPHYKQKTVAKPCKESPTAVIQELYKYFHSHCLENM